jgi:hypothetical protein
MLMISRDDAERLDQGADAKGRTRFVTVRQQTAGQGEVE